MKTELNPHGLMARLYRNFYNTGGLPNNLCPYFWKLIIAIISFPFVWPAMLLNSFTNPYYYKKDYYNDWKEYAGGLNRIPSLIGIILNILLFFGGILLSVILYGKPTAQHIGLERLYVNGIILAVFVTVFFYLIGFLIRLIPKKKKKILTYEEEDELWRIQREKNRLSKEKWQRSFVYLCWKAFIAWKDRVCPQIEWKYDK